MRSCLSVPTLLVATPVARPSPFGQSLAVPAVTPLPTSAGRLTEGAARFEGLGSVNCRVSRLVVGSSGNPSLTLPLPLRLPCLSANFCTFFEPLHLLHLIPPLPEFAFLLVVLMVTITSPHKLPYKSTLTSTSGSTAIFKLELSLSLRQQQNMAETFFRVPSTLLPCCVLLPASILKTHLTRQLNSPISSKMSFFLQTFWVRLCMSTYRLRASRSDRAPRWAPFFCSGAADRNVIFECCLFCEAGQTLEHT